MLASTVVEDKRVGLCRFTFHAYGMWKVIERGPVVSEDLVTGKKFNTGNYLVQERQCQQCGKTQIKSQKVSI